MEIKKCPFCGGEAVLVSLMEYKYFLYCKHCKVEQGKVYKSKTSAIKAWNRRVNNND